MTDYSQYLSELIKRRSHCHDKEILPLINLFEIKKYCINDYIFQFGGKNTQIGFVCNGILRSYVLDNDGNENNLFFSMEHDFIIGNLSPRMSCSFNEQSLTDSTLLVADYHEYYSLLNQNRKLLEFHENMLSNIHDKIRDRISKDFFSNSKKKYEMFLEGYPGLLNRIPHYYIANYLGISPTQLSRIRKDFLR